MILTESRDMSSHRSFIWDILIHPYPYKISVESRYGGVTTSHLSIRKYFRVHAVSKTVDRRSYTHVDIGVYQILYNGYW